MAIQITPLQIGMTAALIAVIVAIRFAAPYLIELTGHAGALAFIAGCFALAKSGWLED